MNAAYTEFSRLMKHKAFGAAADLAARQSAAADERSDFWLTQLSLALRDAGRFDEALAAADNACALAPRNAWALIARAEALLKKGDIGAALDSFAEAVSDARAGGRARKGMLACLAAKKEWDRILSFCAQHPLPPADAFTWRVRSLVELGRREEAEAVCDQQLAADPDKPAALWKKTELRVADEGVEPVLRRFARLARIPGKPPVYAEIHAWLCKRAGNVSGAAEQYTRIAQSTSDVSVLRKQAFALAKSGGEERAVPLMEELLRMTPDDMYLHSAYVPACNRLGDLGRAWKFYHELLALHPESKGLYGRLKRIGRELEKKNKGPVS